MDTFHPLAGVPVRSVSQEVRHRLPLRRDRGRALHSTHVRGSASSPRRKLAGFYHGASLARGRRNVSVRGFGLCEQMVDLPVYIPAERQNFWSRGSNVQSSNDRRKVVHIRDEHSSHKRSCCVLWIYSYTTATEALSVAGSDRADPYYIWIG